MDFQDTIVGLIIFIAVGLALTLSFTSERLNVTTITNESLTLTDQGGGTYNGSLELAHERITPGSDVLANGSKTFTRDANYTIDVDDGTIEVLSNLSNAPLNISYTYRAAGYVSGGATRSIVAILAIIVAVGAFAFIANKMGE